MYHGDEITAQSPGGGGWGNPFERDPEAVLADVDLGIVTIDGARNDYGVAITADLEIDYGETTRLREGRA